MNTLTAPPALPPSRAVRPARLTTLAWALGLAAAVGLVHLPARAAAAGPGTDHPATPAAAHALPAPQPFDAQRWAALQREAAPAVVVFTSTDCSHCPAAIARIHAFLQAEGRAGRPVPRLDLVVMDGADQPELLESEAHYRLADRLFVFEGQAARVRRSVDPRWFGQTPYIGLLPRPARAGEAVAVRFIAGTPSADDLERLR